MSSPLEIRHVDSNESQGPAPSLLHHLPVGVRAPLFPFLTGGDFIALLWAVPTLQEDEEIARRALDGLCAVNKHTKCCFRRCNADWCAAVPMLSFNSSERCILYHETTNNTRIGEHNSPNLRPAAPKPAAPKRPARQRGHLLFHERGTQGASVPGRPTSVALAPSRTALEFDQRSVDEIMRAWRTELGSRERCGALLSLTWLMATELKPLLYSTVTPTITAYTIVPFILPLSRLEEIAREHPAPGPATSMGCHIENFTGGNHGEADVVTCALCTAIESTVKDGIEHYQRRMREEYELENLAYDDACEDYEARRRAFLEDNAAKDELYDDDNLHYNLGSILATWSAEGKISPLKLIGSVDEEDLDAAVQSVCYYKMGPRAGGYCRSHLRPLAAFFRRNGFGPIHRATLEEGQFTPDICPDEIASIEMVGAAAPHGFFAGVYILSRSC